MQKTADILLIVLLLLPVQATFAHTPPEEAKIFFIGIHDNAEVKNPLKLTFGISGFGITPAGTKGKIRHTAGHHHLLIDVKALPDMDAPIPRDEQHIHFDNGETTAQITLNPGIHTLQLLLGDEDHEPQDPPLISEKITITVKEY